jgi:hypothetical protein
VYPSHLPKNFLKKNHHKWKNSPCKKAIEYSSYKAPWAITEPWILNSTLLMLEVFLTLFNWPCFSAITVK